MQHVRRIKGRWAGGGVSALQLQAVVNGLGPWASPFPRWGTTTKIAKIPYNLHDLAAGRVAEECNASCRKVRIRGK